MSASIQDCEFAAGRDELDSLEPAFEHFYREHYSFVWRSARRMLAGAGEEQLEDVIQDTWIAAYRRFHSFRGECRATTWLFGIVRNVVRNHNRGEHRRARRVDAFAEHEQVREQSRSRGDASTLLLRSMLDAFLRTLDDDKRAVFVLAELEGYSAREIAETLAINPNTAQSRLRAARRQFCAHFDLPGSREQIAARLEPLREQPEQPPTQALARSRALLLVGIGEGALSGGGAGALGLAALGQGLLAKLLVGAGVLVMIGVGVAVTSDDARSESSEVAAVEREAPRSTATVELAAIETERELDAVAPIPVTAPARVDAAKPDVYELVREARAALVAGQPARALELLREVPGRNTTLREQRVATEIAALCRLDRGDEARRVAEAFAADAPGSALLERIQFVCW